MVEQGEAVRRLDDIMLVPNQARALSELRQRLFDEFDIQSIILYGSAARGEADEESDLDLLIITPRPFASRFARHAITDVVFEVNLRYGTNLSSLVIDRSAWEIGMMTVLPLRDEILRDGVAL
jgi:predicted nucleotidyltransferase